MSAIAATIIAAAVVCLLTRRGLDVWDVWRVRREYWRRDR